MSQEVLLRGLFSGLMSLAFVWAVFSKHDNEVGSDIQNSDRQKYLPYIPGSLLPLFLLALTILGLCSYGVTDTARMILSTCISMFFHISLFYLVLILVLPVLRKNISARACATIWLLPNYLYIINQSYMKLPSPKWVITIPGKLIWMLFSVWFVGFSAVLLWKTIDHLFFRNKILKASFPVSDPDVIAVWNAILEDSKMKNCQFKLVISPNVATPLTLGLFRRTTRVVLPEKTYSTMDLELILRHEIIHIGREDPWNKFFMVFCTAMCWFNPLMWIAMRKSADDLELSCDETVLLNADQTTRQQYAKLLLDAAGNERGFTTCLSVSADAMRYRLRSIAKPAKRRTGAWIVGAIFFVLCMTSGYISFAYDGDTGVKRIYWDNNIENYSVRSITLSDDDYARNYVVVDEQAFHEYLSGLKLYYLSGNYSFSDRRKSFTYLMDTPEGTLGLVLWDSALKVVPLYGEDPDTRSYYIAGGIDWEYLSTIIFEYPAMKIHLSEERDSCGRDSKAILTKLWKIDNGERKLLHEENYPEGGYHGLFTSAPFPRSATFHTSYELAEPMSVLVENWDNSQAYIITQPSLSDVFTIDLPNCPAHYTIHTMLYGKDGQIYEAEFWYNIGQIYSG